MAAWLEQIILVSECVEAWTCQRTCLEDPAALDAEGRFEAALLAEERNVHQLAAINRTDRGDTIPAAALELDAEFKQLQIHRGDIVR